jgi:hypothetical protein
MAIVSNAFGRVTLSGADAKKFEAQVTHGKPKAAAAKSAARGRELLKGLKSGNGTVKLAVKL